MKLINQIIGEANKQFGTKSYDDMNLFSEVNSWISSGIPEVDYYMQTLGYAPGIMEISGNSRSGKTTTGLHFLKETERAGGVPILVSSEMRENKKYALKIGIDTKNVLIIRARTLEDIFDRTMDHIDLIRNKSTEVPIGVLVDSIGATPSKAERESKDDQKFMAEAAKVIKQRLRKYTQKITEDKIVFNMINHRYDKVGQLTWGDKSKSYGGSGIELHSQLRFKLSLKETLKGVNEKKIGQVTKIEVLKSDFCQPMQSIEFDILWGYGAIPSKKMCEFAFDNDILLKNGAHGYKFKKKTEWKWKNRNQYYELCKDKIFREMFIKMLLKNIHKEVKINRGI